MLNIDEHAAAQKKRNNQDDAYILAKQIFKF